MKKILLTLYALCLTIFPVITYASEYEEIDLSTYTTLNLKEVLAEEKIEEAYSEYKETEDQITIYMFRGNGCGFCQGFIKFLNSISEEYGKYFKLVSFDAWYIEENAILLEKISEFIGQPASGVPYIIIGEQVFGGYAEDYDDAIKTAIKDLYDSEDRYDVFEEYNEYMVEQAKKEAWEKYSVILYVFLFVAVGTIINVVYINKSNKMILAELASLKKMNEKEVKDEVKKEDKKEVKKEVKKVPEENVSKKNTNKKRK